MDRYGNQDKSVSSREDCCAEAQQQFNNCFETSYTANPGSCSKPGCQCASFPAYEVSPGLDTGGWAWSEINQQYVWEHGEISTADVYWMYQCSCHPSPSTGMLLAGCCHGGMGYGRRYIGGDSGPGMGGQGGPRMAKGGSIRKRRKR